MSEQHLEKYIEIDENWTLYPEVQTEWHWDVNEEKYGLVLHKPCMPIKTYQYLSTTGYTYDLFITKENKKTYTCKVCGKLSDTKVMTKRNFIMSTYKQPGNL